MRKASDRIEDLRVAWERDVERAMGVLPTARPPARDPGASDPRVQLDSAMAGRVHRVAGLAAERLGFDAPFALYQTPSPHRHLSAQALMEEAPFAVRLIGPVAGVLDDEALAALIGHELGHALALGPRATPPSTVLRAWEHGVSEDLCRLGTLATELTADRFSLVAADGELEAVVRLEVAIQTLDSPRALGVNELEYLAGVRRKLDSGHEPFFHCASGYFNGYPSSAVRMFALWLFWRSEVHRELTGRGSGELALRDIDVALRAMADEALAREARAQPAPAPPAAPRPPAKAPAPPPRAATPLADGVRALASSVLETVGSYVTAVVGDPEAEPAREESLAELEELDDLEVRFRTLEREAGARAAAPAPVSDDLEARFRALEEREKR